MRTKERKIGHRRVDQAGIVSYKKVRRLVVFLKKFIHIVKINVLQLFVSMYLCMCVGIFFFLFSQAVFGVSLFDSTRANHYIVYFDQKTVYSIFTLSPMHIHTRLHLKLQGNTISKVDNPKYLGIRLYL